MIYLLDKLEIILLQSCPAPGCYNLHTEVIIQSIRIHRRLSVAEKYPETRTKLTPRKSGQTAKQNRRARDLGHLDVSVSRLGSPGSHTHLAGHIGIVRVGVIEEGTVIQPDLKIVTFTSNADIIPLARVDAAGHIRGYNTSAAAYFLFNSMLDISPAAKIEPIEIVTVWRTEQDQKALVASVFPGFQVNFIVFPGRIAEFHVNIRRQTRLNEVIPFYRPDAPAAAVYLKAAIPDQLAP
ncbi:hypothetical protein ES703_109874 [subsurface metagenome]